MPINHIRQSSSSQVCRSKTPYSNLEVMDRRTADFMSMVDSGLAHAGAKPNSERERIGESLGRDKVPRQSGRKG
jgi:hypothetical protein